jgi:hypothetical protein
MRKGITKVYFVATIASLTAPTTAEVTAGTRLDTQLAEINGFEFANNPIDTPDMSAAFVSKIPGEDAVSDSSLVFYEDKTSNPIATALAKNVVGNIVIFYGGTAGVSPALGDKCEVWPIIVGSNAKKYTTGNEAAQYAVVFTNTAAPVAGTLT